MGQDSLVTKKEFKDGFDKLQQCFPMSSKIDSDTVLRYWEYLGENFTSKEFVDTIETIIITERFFPSISVFFKLKEKTLFQKAF